MLPTEFAVQILEHS